MALIDDPWPSDALAKGSMLHFYRLEAILGRGGFGITYRAVDGVDQKFAVKECYPAQFARREGADIVPISPSEAVSVADCQQRFHREAKALIKLARDGAAGDSVVKVETYFEANNTAYMVMELISGRSFESVMQEHPRGMEPTWLRLVFNQLLHAVHCVHQAGFLHRDIKPANILIRDSGKPVLLDFGSSRGIGPDQNSSFTGIYSRRYGPIEQQQGAEQGHYSDIYALGATFYQAIGGILIDAAIRNEAALKRRPDPLVPAMSVGAGRYDENFLRVIDACLALHGEARLQSIQAVIEILRQIDRPATLGTPTMMTTVAQLPDDGRSGRPTTVPDQTGMDERRTLSVVGEIEAWPVAVTAAPAPAPARRQRSALFLVGLGAAPILSTAALVLWSPLGSISASPALMAPPSQPVAYINPPRPAEPPKPIEQQPKPAQIVQAAPPVLPAPAPEPSPVMPQPQPVSTSVDLVAPPPSQNSRPIITAQNHRVAEPISRPTRLQTRLVAPPTSIARRMPSSAPFAALAMKRSPITPRNQEALETDSLPQTPPSADAVPEDVRRADLAKNWGRK